MIQYHQKIVQGSEEWHKARCGILTASKISQLITPTLKIANDDDSRTIVFQTMVERITGYIEPEFQSFDMMRGHEEELEARMLYSKTYEPVESMGFVTNDRFGFTVGWSPDGLVNGRKGAIQNKSRKNRIQVKNILAQEVPKEDVIQLQAELLFGELDWIDYNSYSNGLPMLTMRVEPNLEIQNAIIEAMKQFEETVTTNIKMYHEITQNPSNKFIPTERKEYKEEITV